MKNLIVNADDLGWTEGVNQGIADAFRNGVVTSASMLANGAAFEGGLEVARCAPGLGLGVHLNLSDGVPIADREAVTSLLNDRGEFAGGPERLFLKQVRRGLVLNEVEPSEAPSQSNSVVMLGGSAVLLSLCKVACTTGATLTRSE